MLFNSVAFIFAFLPLVVLGFHGLRRLSRDDDALLWLTVTSAFFYAYWRPPYLLLLIASILFNYYTARRLDDHLERQEVGRARRLLIARIALNILLLGYFKYAAFIASQFSRLVGVDWQFEQRTLPLGISFYTFTEIAFLVDIYRRLARPGKMRDYFLFVTFFPHLIAGPIVHYRQLVPQFKDRTEQGDAHDLALGLAIFVAGLFKKVVLADTFAVYASPAFDMALPSGTPLSLLPAWGAALAYTFQLYFDFSGYSDMAIGLARVFGIRFPINFDSPYKATSIIDFWRRWHITLSSFLRDYLYIPLGGSRKGRVRRHLNLLLTMGLGGLWHGAGWTFIVWGLFHGTLLVLNHLWKELRGSAWKGTGGGEASSSPLGAALDRAATFLAVVVGWVLFRAHTLPQAVQLLRSMVGYHGVVFPRVLLNRLGSLGSWGPTMSAAGIRFESLDLTYWGGVHEVMWLLGGLFVTMALPNTTQLFLSAELAPSTHVRWRWAPTTPWALLGGVALTLAIVTLLTNSASEFLYFNF
ncbi:MAG: MBOAT family protein [Myxococcales bacterium]